MSDHKEIWLEPECCADSDTGRTWCQDANVWDHNDESIQHDPCTRYVRGDLYDDIKRQLEMFRPYVSHWRGCPAKADGTLICTCGLGSTL